MTICLICGIYTAASLALVTRFNATAVLDLVHEFQPTIFAIVPAMADALCDAIEASEHPAAIHHLRLCISGAAPLPLEVAEVFKRLTGAEIIEGYGLTEAGPVTHANLAGKNKTGSVGLPMPDTYCRIADSADPA